MQTHPITTYFDPAVPASEGDEFLTLSPCAHVPVVGAEVPDDDHMNESLKAIEICRNSS